MITIGICGGSASGKSTLANGVCEYCKGDAIALSMDSYYLDYGVMSLQERELINYDHPSAFDIELLIEHIRLLRLGEVIECPQFSYVSHMRLEEKVRRKPQRLLVIEGLYALFFPRVRELLDHKFFLRTTENLRYERILSRDTAERNENVELTKQIYFRDIKPMHIQFVESQIEYADYILNGDTPECLLKNVLEIISVIS